MRVVSIGDLVTDYYYKNEKFLGINGGMTSHNIIANLAKMGINTAVFGVCGNDMQGEIAIKSLKKSKTLESSNKNFTAEFTNINSLGRISLSLKASKYLSISLVPKTSSPNPNFSLVTKITKLFSSSNTSRHPLFSIFILDSS